MCQLPGEETLRLESFAKMPGATKPHMVWDGEVINYIPWRDLIKKELEDFQSEEVKMFFCSKSH